MAKQSVSSDFQIMVQAKWFDRKEKKWKHGFAKYDGRKKKNQTIYIRNRKTGEMRRIEGTIGNKKAFKKLKARIDFYFHRKSINRKPILEHIPKLTYRHRKFSLSQEYSKRYEKEKYTRQETIQIVDYSLFWRRDEADIFYSAFDLGKNFDIVYFVIRLKIIFVHKKKGSYVVDWFCFSRRIDSGISEKTQRKVLREIIQSIEDKLKALSQEYATKEIQIENYIAFLKKVKNEKANKDKR